MAKRKKDRGELAEYERTDAPIEPLPPCRHCGSTRVGPVRFYAKYIHVTRPWEEEENRRADSGVADNWTVTCSRCGASGPTDGTMRLAIDAYKDSPEELSRYLDARNRAAGGGRRVKN